MGVGYFSSAEGIVGDSVLHVIEDNLTAAELKHARCATSPRSRSTWIRCCTSSARCADLEVPEGMGVILRTAGASRTKIEIKRDFEYLLRMWETVRDLTLKSTAPKLVYEEGSLVKRSIRDLYSKDIDEVIVAGVRGLSGGQGFHAHAHAEPCQERQTLRRHPAAVVALRRRKPARRHVLAGRATALRRLHRAQSGRSAGRDRRQFRPRHARAPYRGHRAQDQSRSRPTKSRVSCGCATSPD